MHARAPGPGGRWVVSSGRPDPGTVRRLLAALPDWFGSGPANEQYVESARTLPTYLVRPAGEAGGGPGPGPPAGVLLAARHFPRAAEIHLLAVDPAWHRHGAGTALVRALEAGLAADGVRLLQVKTLGPAHPDPGYDRTRRFYLSLGFEPLEEIHGLWPDDPCLLMVKVLDSAAGRP